MADTSNNVSSKPKKKNIVTSFFSKKKQTIPEEAEAPTAPNTPDAPEAVDVTVVASTFDPSQPFGLQHTISELSDGNWRSPADSRKVDFQVDEAARENVEREKGAPEDERVGYQSDAKHPLTTFPAVEERAAVDPEDAERQTMTAQNASDKHCHESILNQTLGYFDDICQIPQSDPPETPADASTLNSSRAATEWGTVPSEDDDTTYRDSLPSTIDESTADRTYSIVTGTTGKSPPTTTDDSQSKQTIPKSPSHDHENFEVVLDSTVLQEAPKKAFNWFPKKKNDDDHQEEEKKIEEMDEIPNDQPMQFESPVKESKESPPRKSLVKRLFSSRKKKKRQDDAKGDTVPSEKPDETTENVEKWNTILEQLEPADKETGDSWNSMLGQLEKPNKKEQAKSSSADTRKEGENKAKDKKKKKHSRTISWSAVARSFKRPTKTTSKRSNDDSNIQYEGKPASTASIPKQKKQKPAWKAVVDPNSGKTYYYHRKTRKTTWIKPDELKELEGDAAKQSTPVHKNGLQDELIGRTQTETEDQPKEAGAEAVFSTPQRKTNADEAETPASTMTESPIKPPLVVEAALTVESKQQINNAEQGKLDDGCDRDVEDPSNTLQLDDAWEKRKEIERLLTDLSPPDKSAVDKLMKEYEGKEDMLLRQLRDKVESQPFDEPFLEETSDTISTASRKTSMSAPKLNSRTMTYMSKASATTKSSTLTDKTERIKNTFSSKSLIETISENHSTATSISSRHDDDRLDKAPATAGNRFTTDTRIPSRVPVPRERELMVEELTNSRVAAETFDSKGRVVRGRVKEPVAAEEGSYYGDNEVDTLGTDSVSALSDHDTDFLHRKENFDAARRRALDDAIEREDWDLAAALSEGMSPARKSGDYAKEHVSWNQSELDKFIANNDWEAVKRYIARMRDQKSPSKASVDEEISRANTTGNGSSTVAKPPSRSRGKKSSKRVDLSKDSALTKRIGSKSQLQHRELVSESSWTSESSYDDSYDSEYS